MGEEWRKETVRADGTRGMLWLVDREWWPEMAVMVTHHDEAGDVMLFGEFLNVDEVEGLRDSLTVWLDRIRERWHNS